MFGFQGAKPLVPPGARIFPRMSMRLPRMEVKDEGIKGRG